MARKRFVETLRFYNLLDVLTFLPDDCVTEPYYFKGVETFDFFCNILRKNNPLKFVVRFYQKELVKRNSFTNTFCKMEMDFDLSVVNMLLFDSQIEFFSDFIKVCCRSSEQLKTLLTDVFKYESDSIVKECAAGASYSIEKFCTYVGTKYGLSF